MLKQIEVKVRDISKDEFGRKTELYGTERILTYKSFLMLNSDPENPRYELIAQVEESGKDEKGNPLYKEVPGNPNLEAQHRQQLQQKNAGPADSVTAGPTQKEIEQAAEIAALKAQLAVKMQSPVETVVGPDAEPEKPRRGRPAKAKQEEVTV